MCKIHLKEILLMSCFNSWKESKVKPRPVLTEINMLLGFKRIKKSLKSCTISFNQLPGLRMLPLGTS